MPMLSLSKRRKYTFFSEDPLESSKWAEMALRVTWAAVCLGKQFLCQRKREAYVTLVAGTHGVTQLRVVAIRALLILALGPGFHCMGSRHVPAGPRVSSFDASQRDSLGGTSRGSTPPLYRYHTDSEFSQDHRAG